MNYVLYYREFTTFDNHPKWMSKISSMYGFHPLIINRVDDKFNENTFATIEEVAEKHKDKTWIWLDHRGRKYLDNFKHPEDNCVYAFGSDVDGFDGFDLKSLPNHEILKLRQEGEHYSSIVLQMTMYDRFLSVNGYRK